MVVLAPTVSPLAKVQVTIPPVAAPSWVQVTPLVAVGVPTMLTEVGRRSVTLKASESPVADVRHADGVGQRLTAPDGAGVGRLLDRDVRTLRGVGGLGAAVVALVELVEDVVRVGAGLVVERPAVLGDEGVDDDRHGVTRGQVAHTTDVVDRVLLDRCTASCRPPPRRAGSVRPAAGRRRRGRSIGSVAVFVDLDRVVGRVVLSGGRRAGPWSTLALNGETTRLVSVALLFVSSDSAMALAGSMNTWFVQRPVLGSEHPDGDRR